MKLYTLVFGEVKLPEHGAVLDFNQISILNRKGDLFVVNSLVGAGVYSP
jgi:hypothetical protein